MLRAAQGAPSIERGFLLVGQLRPALWLTELSRAVPLWPYCLVRAPHDEYSVQDGLVFKGNWIVSSLNKVTG